jgi:uncharacterized radical SAM superfamily Fe-S cluster-containing enzyme
MNRFLNHFHPALSTVGNMAWKATNVAAGFLQSDAPHPVWAPGPLPRASERSRPEFGFPRATKSLCPECNREAVNSVLHHQKGLDTFIEDPGVIDAQLVEEAGRILMRKACDKHGPLEDVISSDADFTKRMESLYFGQDYDRSDSAARSASGCACSVEKGRGCFLIVDLTNRCNMKCSPCFMDANNLGYVNEMTLEEVKQIFDNARAIKPQREMAVLFSGGEPTIAPVFLDAVRYAKSAGFDRLLVATNGIKFAEDPAFVQEAHEAGLHGVYLQLDGATNAANLHRGVANLFDVKCKALENIKNAGMRSTLQVTVVNGLNDKSIGEIVQFGLNNIDKIQGVVFQPVMFAGRDARVGDEDRYERRYTLADLAHGVAEQLPNDIQVMRDWFPMSVYSALAHLIDQMNPDSALGSVYSDIHPNHGQSCPLVVDQASKKFVPLAKFFDVEGFLRDVRVIGDCFTGKFLTKMRVATSIARNLRLELAPEGFTLSDAANLFHQMYVREKHETSGVVEGRWRLFIVAGMWFQDLFNIDLTAIKMSSTLVATNTQDGEISFCAYNAGGWRTLVEDLNEKVQLPEWHSRHGRHAIYANGKFVNIAGLPDVQPIPIMTPTEEPTPVPAASLSGK